MVTNTKRKPLDFYLKLKYPVTLIPAEEGGYAVEIEDLPGCYSQGETVEEAIEMIEEARKLWMESMYEDGQEIPLPSNQVEYSGKFNVRVPASLHRKLHKLAVKEGVSLNQYVVYALSHTAGVAEAKRPYKTK
jgi:predicted RNase H-like HicB family nuclease